MFFWFTRRVSPYSFNATSVFWATIIHQILLELLQLSGLPVLLRCHFYLGFRFLLVHATSFFVLRHSYSHFLLMRDAV